MNISLTQAAEGSCDTTVTANAQDAPEPPEPPGQPATETATVDNSRRWFGKRTVWRRSVDGSLHEDLGGEDTTEWSLIVENTGQQEATIDLSIGEDNDASGCSDPGSLDPTLSQNQVTLGSEESIKSSFR